jgi:sugar phosphate permease
LSKNNPIFYGWWVVAAGFGMWFAGAASPFSIILKQLMAEFNSGRGAVSILPALFAIASGIGAFIVSRLIRRHPPKRFMLWGSAIGGVLFLLCATVNSLWQLYVLYFLIGFILNGAAGAIPLLTILSNWFKKRRGLAVGITFSGIALGSIIITPLIGIIASNFGWRATYLFCGGITLLLNIPLISLVIKNSPGQMGLLPDGDTPETVNRAIPEIKPYSSKTSSASLATYLKRTSVWLIIAGFPLMVIGGSAMMQHLVSFVTDMGISATVAASALGITGGIGGISGLTSGWLCDKIPRKHVMTIFGALILISIVILINTHTLSMLWIFVIFFGLGNGAAGIVFPLVVGDIFGAEGYATVFGFANFLFCVGWAFGPPLAGYIFDASGSYFIVFMIVAALQILSIVAIYIAYTIERKPAKKRLG